MATPGGASASRVALDPLPALAALLPRGADRCVIARPSLLGADQRRLFLRLSRADPLAWSSELEVAAFAAAGRSARRGSSPRVMLLSVQGAPAQLRELLDRHAGLQLSWDGGPTPCTPDACPQRASVPAPNVVRLEYGDWPELQAPGVEARCRRLAAQHDGALETMVARSRRIAMLERGSLLGGPALRTRMRVVATRRGVRVSQSELMPSFEAAVRALAGAELMAGSELEPRRAMHQRQVDSELLSDYEVLWEDLWYAEQDDLRARSAQLLGNALEKLRPAEAIELDDRDGLMAQIDYRRQRIMYTGADPAALAGELSALLSRALERYPDDTHFAFVQCDLWLHHLHRPADAHALAERFISQQRAFRVLRREAAAQLSVAALVAALQEDGVVLSADPQARTAASRIIAHVRQGMDYLDAEQAALRARR